MPRSYIVKFYREVPGGPRRVGQVLLDSVYIRRARDRQRAIEAATLKFKRKRAALRWSGRPTSFQVEGAEAEGPAADRQLLHLA